MALLAINDLRTWFETEAGSVRAVDGVSLSVEEGETVALVGESGSGKSVLSLSVMGLVPPPGRMVAGTVSYGGQNLATIPERERRGLRGREMAMIFQDPMTSLNPVIRVGEQIAEPLRHHLGLSRREAAKRAVGLLEEVGIPDPAERARSHPHTLSGGMRQRVMIAMAIACGPKLLIADEPTTALDVTVQAQILDLLRDLQARSGMAILFVTHDLGVVAEIADRVAVLYAGKIVEEASATNLFASPRMPYTRGLLASVPSLAGPVSRLTGIEGSVPSGIHRPTGCAFHPRCGSALDLCREVEPDPEEAATDHMVRCHRHEELRPDAAEVHDGTD
jgi:oligopeptide/dipeptide ABC transporter ATP-binding protein